MTKEEAVKAAAMGVPVVYLDPMSGARTVYRRISAVIWQYATLDSVLDEKKVYVELLPDNGARSSRVVSPDRVEPANKEQWAVQREIAVEPEPQKTKKKREVFQKPTREEVAAYCLAELYEIDVGAFMDHYDACGWVVGRNKPMKDWKAAVRQWARRDKADISAANKESESKGSFDTDEFWAAAVARSYEGLEV